MMTIINTKKKFGWQLLMLFKRSSVLTRPAISPIAECVFALFERSTLSPGFPQLDLQLVGADNIIGSGEGRVIA
jgi:hypothetical protein